MPTLAKYHGRLVLCLFVIKKGEERYTCSCCKCCDPPSIISSTEVVGRALWTLVAEIANLFESLLTKQNYFKLTRYRN